MSGVNTSSAPKRGEHQTVMMGWTGDNGDPDNFFATLFSCAAAKDGSNYSRWCYKPFEDLIQPARAESNHDKRIELYKQAQVVMPRSGSGADCRTLHRVRACA
ncbi:Dipeptide-binding protein [Serratia marcescens]|uniref:Dipeptide-binding protein n=1 Tax=Serratia marcescens TaxID=615 RepID=A0A379Y6I1_SERMA|nr:Dipeptide-binding protein [Serratia marcescens]